MKVEWLPWKSLWRPYRVTAREVYEIHRTSRSAFPDDPFWVLDNSCHHWLEDLPPIKVMGREWRAVIYDYCSPRVTGKTAFNPRALYLPDEDMPDPPFMWFARKNDVLLFKLTYGGR